MLVLTLLCSVPMLSFLSPIAEPLAHRVMPDRVAYQGKIASWSISTDGTVALQLVGTHGNKEFSLWFATPASRTTNTSFEGLVLDAVLAFVGPLEDVLVTVVSDSSNEDSGKSVEDALTLSSIGELAQR